MSQYRKKPVVIEAEQLTPEKADDLAEWAGGWVIARTIGDGPEEVIGIGISTLEGPITASLRDWIIKGVKGEFYPCKPDVFEATYEPVEA